MGVVEEDVGRKKKETDRADGWSRTETKHLRAVPGKRERRKKGKRKVLVSAGCGCQAMTGNRREKAADQARWVPPDRWSTTIIHCLGGRHLSDK